MLCMSMVPQHKILVLIDMMLLDTCWFWLLIFSDVYCLWYHDMQQHMYSFVDMTSILCFHFGHYSLDVWSCGFFRLQYQYICLSEGRPCTLVCLWGSQLHDCLWRSVFCFHPLLSIQQMYMHLFEDLMLAARLDVWPCGFSRSQYQYRWWSEDRPRSYAFFFCSFDLLSAQQFCLYPCVDMIVAGSYFLGRS